jgi:hypothetical protein
MTNTIYQKLSYIFPHVMPESHIYMVIKPRNDLQYLHLWQKTKPYILNFWLCGVNHYVDTSEKQKGSPSVCVYVFFFNLLLRLLTLINEYGAVGGMRIGRRYQSKKAYPSAFSDMTWDWTLAATARNWRLCGLWHGPVCLCILWKASNAMYYYYYY